MHLLLKGMELRKKIVKPLRGRRKSKYYGEEETLISYEVELRSDFSSKDLGLIVNLNRY